MIGPDIAAAFGFHTWCIDSRAAELITLAVVVDRWWPAIDAFVLTGITNADTEGYSRLVKQFKRSHMRIPQCRQLRPSDTVPPTRARRAHTQTSR